MLHIQTLACANIYTSKFYMEESRVAQYFILDHIMVYVIESVSVFSKAVPFSKMSDLFKTARILLQPLRW